MELAVTRRKATVAVLGAVWLVGFAGVAGCQKNTPPPPPAAAVEVPPVTPPPYVPPQPPPVVVTPAEPTPTPQPVVAPDPPAPTRTQPAQRPAAQAPAATPAAAGAIRPGSTYTVQRGDTLSGIAVRAYGRGNVNRNVAAIKRANNLQSDTIRVGQKLRIPPRTTGNKD